MPKSRPSNSNRACPDIADIFWIDSYLSVLVCANRSKAPLGIPLLQSTLSLPWLDPWSTASGDRHSSKGIALHVVEGPYGSSTPGSSQVEVIRR